MKAELSGLAITVLVIDLASAAVSVVLCAVFFGVTPVTVGSCLLAASLLLALSAGGAGTVGPVPGGVVQWPNRFSRGDDARQVELLVKSALNNPALERRRVENLSWALVAAVASASLFATATFLLIGVAE